MPFRQLRETKASPKIVVVGNFGAGNIGDELILAGFLKKLGKELPRAKVVALGGNPNLIRRFHGVNALPHLPTGLQSFWKPGWWRSLKKIRESDAVVFPGGGLFTDEESWHAIFLWGIHLLVARYFWKPVYLLGQSIGPIKSDYLSDFTRFCLRRAEWIGVRDSASANELKRLGIPARKIQTGRDTSFWLASRAPKVKNLKRNGVIKILVSVRDFPKIKDKFFRELSKALDQLSEKNNFRIFFAEFGKEDAKTWKKISQKGKHSKLWKTLQFPESAEGVIGEIKKFDVVIGMRLHSLIAAKLAGIPAIGIAYSRKVSAFAENNLEVKDFKAEKLLSLLK